MCKESVKNNTLTVVIFIIVILSLLWDLYSHVRFQAWLKSIEEIWNNRNEEIKQIHATLSWSFREIIIEVQKMNKKMDEWLDINIKQ